MRRILKIVAVLVLILIAGVAAFLLTFDLNRYKPQIIAAVRRTTHRDFDISGPIGLKASLIPTLSVNGVTLGNAGWSQAGPMITLDHLAARIAIKPLLDRRIEISDFELQGVHVLLETDQDGHGNWSFSQPQIEPPGAAPAAAQPLPVIDLRALTIGDAVVDYRAHGAKPQSVRIERLSLTSAGNGQPLQLGLETTFQQHRLTAHGTLAPLAQWLANANCAVDVSVEAGTLKLALKGEVAQPLSAPVPKLTFALSAPTLAAIDPLIGSKLPPLAPLAVSGALALGDPHFGIDSLALTLGKTVATGQVKVALGGARPRIDATLNAAMIDLSPFDPPPPTNAAKAAPAAGSDRLLPDTPLPLAALATVDARLALDATTLLTHGIAVNRLKLVLALEHGSLNITTLSATAEGGTVQATALLESAATPPRLRAQASVKGFALKRWFDGKSGITAPTGHADVVLDIDGRGASIAALLGTANGHVRVDASGLKLANKMAGLAGGDLLLHTLSLLNPLSQRSDETVIECAVLNFPLHQGRMDSKTGLGIRTNQLTILGGGRIDLKSEQIDIGVDPKPRSGIGLNLAGFAGFVRLGGTLAHPTPATDAAGVATAGIKVGTAVATGGLSVLAEGLFKRSEGDLDVCAIARGEQKSAATATAGSAPGAAPTQTAPATSTLDKAGAAASSLVKGAGNAVKGVFEGLFGH